MRVLVLTGSSGGFCFEESICQLAGETSWRWTLQTARKLGCSLPRNLAVVEHVDLSVDSQKWDLLLTHCGAGSVFFGLEAGIKTIAIVNLHRNDDHQIDLGGYLDRESLCAVYIDRAPTLIEINRALQTQFRSYQQQRPGDIAERLIQIVGR